MGQISLMKRRLKENDPQLKAGFKKFIKRYNKMTRTKTTALLTSAFHCFVSRSGGFATTLCGGRLRRGPRIPIQATAAGRRKTGTRGKATIPKGQLVTAAQKVKRLRESRHCMPVRRKPKGKRPHNLTESINKGQHAECRKVVIQNEFSFFLYMTLHILSRSLTRCQVQAHLYLSLTSSTSTFLHDS